MEDETQNQDIDAQTDSGVTDPPPVDWTGSLFPGLAGSSDPPSLFLDTKDLIDMGVIRADDEAANSLPSWLYDPNVPNTGRDADGPYLDPKTDQGDLKSGHDPDSPYLDPKTDQADFSIEPYGTADGEDWGIGGGVSGPLPEIDDMF